MDRRTFLRSMGLGAGAMMVPGCMTPPGKVHTRPNFIVVFTDDQGYNDLGCYGSPTIKTPRLDRMAEEGIRFTSFYSQPVCGPARASLLTGCQPPRIMRGEWNLDPDEITLAEVLKEAGYATGCIGKWDLSGRKFLSGRLPNDQGFKHFFGTLGANGEGKITLYRDRVNVGETRNMGAVTGLYTDETIELIREYKHQPFFMYLCHTMPHVKLGVSPEFAGKSARGLYGDTIEELDHHTGRLLDFLKDQGLDKNTYVLFTSDNGPWLSEGLLGGSAAPLRGGKGCTWEGGFRVPAILWGPGRVPAGVTTHEMVATLDIMPTFAALAGTTPPRDRVIDGVDQRPLFLGQSVKSRRDHFLFYLRSELQAVRRGKWKLALADRIENYGAFTKDTTKLLKNELYDLQADVGEKKDVADQNPEVVKQLLSLVAEARYDIGDRNLVGVNAR